MNHYKTSRNDQFKQQQQYRSQNPYNYPSKFLRDHTPKNKDKTEEDEEY